MAKKRPHYRKPPTGHTPDPFRRLKLQLQAILAALDLKSSKRIANHFSLTPSAVKALFDPRTEMDLPNVRTLLRITHELGFEVVLALHESIDPLPAEAENTLFHRVPAKYGDPMAGYKPKGIYDHLPDEE